MGVRVRVPSWLLVITVISFVRKKASTMSFDFDQEEMPATEVTKAAGLKELIATVKRRKEEEKRAKLAEACLEVYEKAALKREKMVTEYRAAKKALTEQLEDLKAFTAVVELFENETDPFPLLEAMGISKSEFCRTHNISE